MDNPLICGPRKVFLAFFYSGFKTTHLIYITNINYRIFQRMRQLNMEVLMADSQRKF
jgi:predicted transcriptional regulator